MGQGTDMRDIINKLAEIENDDAVTLHEDVVALITSPDVKFTSMGVIAVGKGITNEDIDRQIDEMCERAWGHFDDNGN